MSTNDEHSTEDNYNDASTRNSGGPPNPESNLQPDADNGTVKCPNCQKRVKNFPNHVNSSECEPIDEDSLREQHTQRQQTQQAIRRQLSGRDRDTTIQELSEEIDRTKPVIRKHCKEMDDVVQTRTISNAHLWAIEDE